MKNRRCPNPACSDHGRVGAGTIVTHGFYRTRFGKRRRYRCVTCGQTFSSTAGTPYYRLQHRRARFDAVVALRVEGVSTCPICLSPFNIEALANRSLTAEHVAPKSVGGRELLLTCKACNNSAGTKLDAAAKTKEDVRMAVAGMLGRPHRIKAKIGKLQVNGELHARGGQYSLQIPLRVNSPNVNDTLRDIARAGTQLTVQHESFSELGAKISWLRSGYLALFAVAGYKVALDPAIQVVRKQILECDERQMVTFTSEAQQDISLTERRILRVLAPQWHLGWAVQFGRYFVQFPSPGDVAFYDRMATYGLEPVVQHTTYKNMGWPDKPTFGLPRIVDAA